MTTQAASGSIGPERTQAPATTPATFLDYQKPSTAFDFFAKPPKEIGAVVYAESTLRQGRQPLALHVRLLAGLVPAAVAAAGVLWFADIPEAPGIRSGSAVVAAVVAAVAVAAGWHFTRFEHRCGYVGEQGITEFELRGNRAARPTSRTLLFRDADGLKAVQSRHYFNGIYTGTVYDYRWIDARGLRRFQLYGTHWGGGGSPGPGHRFHFAAAAEAAWTQHYLPRALAQLEREGSIAFRVDSGRVVRVGPGLLEFDFGGAPARVTRDQIALVTLANGVFSFVHKDATWYRTAGKYRFQYGQMVNGKLFFLVLDKLLGYRWE